MLARQQVTCICCRQGYVFAECGALLIRHLQLSSLHACVLVHAVQEGVTTPQHARALRMTMHAGGFRFTPLPPDPSRPTVPRMEATVLISFDAKKFVVPDAIISFILKVIAPLIHKSVLKVLHTLFHGQAQSASEGSHKEEKGRHSELLERLKGRPEYIALHKHCGKYVGSLNEQQHL